MRPHRKRNYGDPWDRRRHVNAYSNRALREMLVDDLVHYRPPGGPMEPGALWLVLACASIARTERRPVDDIWEGLLDEASNKLGHRCIPALA